MAETSEDMTKARARLVRLLHLRHLGLDPAIKKYRSNEARTADALEHVLDERLERSTGVGDWRSTVTGKVYDDCGPAPTQHFEQQYDTWVAALRAHAITTQGIDVVPVDLRQKNLSPHQTARVVTAINHLPLAAKRKILVLVNHDD